jgi:hypothetical protein
MSSLDHVTSDHLERVRAALVEGFTLAKVPQWVQTRTFLEGAHFSFTDHEYQLKILQDQSREIVIKKCSQVGITELAIRRTLALMDILPDIHVIYTLPTSNFAKQVVKTRFDPVILSSPYLSARVNREIDSMEMKQIGSSYIYIKGTIGQVAAISVPASLLVHDEVDFSDQSVLSSYQSRLSHSRYKMKFRLSTPTVPGFGIDEDFQRSRRHFNQVKCSHCGHWFLPDYFQHVKIPGYDGDLREITKENLHNVDYLNARVVCPHCGEAPSLQPEHRSWACENEREAHVAAGYHVSPFDAPNIITAPYLIEASTKYKRYGDFVNFNLGHCAMDDENGVNRQELERIWVSGEPPRFIGYVHGIDAGLTMHSVVAGVDHEGVVHVVKMRRTALPQYMERFVEDAQAYPLISAVADSQPYVDLVARLQERTPRLYASVFTTSKSTETFTIVDHERDPQASRLAVRLVNVNRNRALDYLMDSIRRGKLKIWEAGCASEKEVWLNHMTDMRRMAKFDANDELTYRWEKSTKGQDHYHFATLYCHIAAQMRDFGEVSTPYGKIFTTFKNKRL